MIGCPIDGEFVSQEDALNSIYYESYREHFETHHDDLQELIETAKMRKKPRSELTGGVDLQVFAIIGCLDRNGLQLTGNDVVDIGTYSSRSHKISVRLSPLTIKVISNPKMTLEKFWQEKKCLAVWQD
jgi:hypothetical protein